MSNTRAHIVDLGTDPSIRIAGELRDRLNAAIARHDSVVVSGDAVASVDISILQLLASAHRSASAAGKTISIRAPAEGALRAALVRAGFVDAQGMPLAAEGDFWTRFPHAAKDEAA